jgi:Uma2 family endonuclease
MIETTQPETAEATSPAEAKATPAPRRVANARWIEMNNVSWREYTAMLRVIGNRPTPRLIYLDGNLTLVTSSQAHERIKKRLGMLVSEVAAGLRVPHMATGQMTFRREARQAGVEGDETYYIANVGRVLGKTIDLEVDPPPDLAIESVVGNPARKAIATFCRLRVPEVWACDNLRLRILLLQENGRYAESPTSAAFPFLTAAEIFEWVSRPGVDDDTEWMLEVRRWVVETLAPRREGR